MESVEWFPYSSCWFHYQRDLWVWGSHMSREGSIHTDQDPGLGQDGFGLIKSCLCWLWASSVPQCFSCKMGIIMFMVVEDNWVNTYVKYLKQDMNLYIYISWWHLVSTVCWLLHYNDGDVKWIYLSFTHSWKFKKTYMIFPLLTSVFNNQLRQEIGSLFSIRTNEFDLN